MRVPLWDGLTEVKTKKDSSILKQTPSKLLQLKM
jgi:hypothetical protein